MAITRLTRKELYDKVWAAPLRKISATHGISDVGLAKICRRHNIPIHGRGYWVKREFGHATTQTPLPDSAQNDVISLTGSALSRDSAPDVPTLELVRPSKLHPLAEKTGRVLEKAPLSWKRLVEPMAGGLHVRVSKDGR